MSAYNQPSTFNGKLNAVFNIKDFTTTSSESFIKFPNAQGDVVLQNATASLITATDLRVNNNVRILGTTTATDIVVIGNNFNLFKNSGASAETFITARNNFGISVNDANNYTTAPVAPSGTNTFFSYANGETYVGTTTQSLNLRGSTISATGLITANGSIATNTISLLYTSLPTFTSSKIGYTLLGTLATGTPVVGFGAIGSSTIPVGIWSVSFTLRFTAINNGSVVFFDNNSTISYPIYTSTIGATTFKFSSGSAIITNTALAVKFLQVYNYPNSSTDSSTLDSTGGCVLTYTRIG